MKHVLWLLLISPTCRFFGQTTYDKTQNAKVATLQTQVASLQTQITALVARFDAKDIKDNDRSAKITKQTADILALQGQLNTLLSNQGSPATINASLAKLGTRVDSTNAAQTVAINNQAAVNSAQAAVNNKQSAVNADQAAVNAAQAVINTNQGNTNANLSSLVIEAGKKVTLTGAPGEVTITKLTDSSYVIGLAPTPSFRAASRQTKKQK